MKHWLAERQGTVRQRGKGTLWVESYCLKAWLEISPRSACHALNSREVAAAGSFRLGLWVAQAAASGAGVGVGEAGA